MEGTKGYKDYYYILGVGPKATKQEIDTAYQDLYDRFGPHVSVMGQDPDAMLKAYKDICEAYEILTDPAKRREYDSNASPQLEKAQLRQLWGKITGQSEGQGQASTGEGTRMDAFLTLKEAAKGTVRKLRIEEHVPCKNCLQLKPVQRMKCDQCRGTGHVQVVRAEEVNIPAKCYDKQELRMSLKGRYDLRSNVHFDLIVTVNIQPHPFFTVNGKDVGCTVPITLLEAVLGAEISVPTMTGKVIMKVQPLSQNGRIYRLKGLGLGGGDFLVTVQVVVPGQISVEELDLYRKLLAINSMKNPRDEIFAKLAAENEASEHQ
jgi:curved DNA-binding protein